ncbi:MAG TPA: hypothetical protein VMJ10_01010 [Kofleriaceae bacterium]|nr:hypothetical protein [Kofleriaceae bacterium]
MLVGLARAARADVCVALDESRDTLSPDDRRGAAISFGQALAKAGIQVTNANCTETYTVYNVKLGDSITVYVIGPNQTTRQARASKIDELPLVYEQIASSFVTGQPMGSGTANVDRTNATSEQMAPRRVTADGLKYVRLGYGAVTGRTNAGGTAFGFGYRYELDQLAIDVSFLNLVWATQDVMDPTTGFTETKGGLNGEWVRIGAVHYQDPIADRSLYYGGGIGYGTTDVYDESTGANYEGSGLQVTALVGYEMLRSSTIRLFVEAHVTLPMYTASFDFSDTGTPDTSNRWTPVAALTIGAGLGHSNTIGVVAR